VIGGTGVHFTVVAKGFNMFKNAKFSWPLASKTEGLN
jgi:hypothetical protein